MFNPCFDKHSAMVNRIADKHIGEMNWLTFDYVLLDIVASNGDIIEQPVPKLVIDFKRWY